MKKQGALNTCGYCNGHDIVDPKIGARDIKQYAVCQSCKAIFIDGEWFPNLAYASEKLGILTVKKELMQEVTQ